MADPQALGDESGEAVVHEFKRLQFVNVAVSRFSVPIVLPPDPAAVEDAGGGDASADGDDPGSGGLVRQIWESFARGSPIEVYIYVSRQCTTCLSG